MTAADIASWLADQSIGTLGTDLFDTALPDNVDNAVLVRDYAGAPPAFEHNQNAPALDFPRVQIVVRNTDIETAFATANTVYTTIHQLRNTDISGQRYRGAQALQSPFWLRQDDQNRHYVVFNVALTVAG